MQRISDRVKKLRRRTNNPDMRIAYQHVLNIITEFEIKDGDYDRCVICNVFLNWGVAEWAYKKGFRWYCGEHYQKYKPIHPIIERHKRSFALLVRKLEREGKDSVPTVRTGS